jgi:deoxyribonuclease-1-like protein
VPTNKNPAKEIRLLAQIPKAYPRKNIIFCGDFNLSGTDDAFDPIKSKGYETSLIDQKTSLKQNCDDGDCLASVYDNFLFRKTKQDLVKSDVIEFFKDFDDFKKARKLSDHIPIFAEFSLN